MILHLLLALIGWCGIILLQLLLMGIARFFERSSTSRTWYRWYLVPIALTVLGALIYGVRIPFVETWPSFTGDPLANIFLLIAGVMLFILSSILHDQMLRGSQP